MHDFNYVIIFNVNIHYKKDFDTNHSVTKNDYKNRKVILSINE